jgi:hypothetical protein
MARSLSPSQRGALYVVVGFALVCNPFVVGAFDIGDPDSYRYEPAEITFFENGTYDAPVGTDAIDSEVACLDSYLPTRSCMLERAVHANGGLLYDGLQSNFIDHGYWYVYVYGSGFFEPVAEETENGTVEYGLSPVSQADALDDVATPFDRAPSGVRTAITTGEFRTSDPIDGTGELVRHDGSYYVVRSVTSKTTEGERRGVVILLQWVLGVGGGWLVLRGQRLRVTGAR